MLGGPGGVELSLVRKLVGLKCVDVCLGRAGTTAKIAMPRCQDSLLDCYINHAQVFEDRTPYYGVLWPSAVGLARAVGTHVQDGHEVLELGCGLGLSGIAAALCANPKQVFLTDHDPAAVRLARLSAKISGVSTLVRTGEMDWLQREHWAKFENGFDVAIAADVIYEPEAVVPVAKVLAHVLRPGGRFLLADTETRLHRARLRHELEQNRLFRALDEHERIVQVEDFHVHVEDPSAAAPDARAQRSKHRVVLQVYERLH